MSDGTDSAGAAVAGASTGTGDAGAFIVDRADLAIATVDTPGPDEPAAAVRRITGGGEESDDGAITRRKQKGGRAPGPGPDRLRSRARARRALPPRTAQSWRARATIRLLRWMRRRVRRPPPAPVP